MRNDMTRGDWIASAIGLAVGLGIAALNASGAGSQVPPSAPPSEGAPAPEADLFEHRLQKYRLIAAHYPDSGIYPWIGTIIREHTRRGMGHAIWYSFIYGAANFSLRCDATAPGRCYGPFDVKAPVPRYRRDACADLHDGSWRNSLLLNPQINTRCHVLEMQEAYQRGYRGRGMCEYVYLPANPRDWGGGRFEQIEQKHQQIIREAYQKGELQ